MTFLWLLVWLLSSTPAIDFTAPMAHWSSWTVAMAVCVLIDLLRIWRKDHS